MPHIPNHPSALKRHRQNLKRHEINRVIKSRVRTVVKKALDAIAGDDAQAAEAALREAISTLDKASSKGTIHRNTVSRKISRLSSRLHKTHGAKSAEQAGS
jgi:small subunit ribosomal protein S20